MLGRRVLRPVKVVLKCDPAVDREKSNYAAYVQDWDEKHLAFVEGEKPTRFTLQQMSSPQRSVVEACNTDRDKAIMTLRYMLRGVDGYTILSPEGEAHEAVLAEPIDTPAGKALPESTVHELGLLNEQLVGLWGLAIVINEASLPLSKR